MRAAPRVCGGAGATAFSGFYWTMLAVLWALFFRPVGFDYRSKMDNPGWRSTTAPNLLADLHGRTSEQGCEAELACIIDGLSEGTLVWRTPRRPS